MINKTITILLLLCPFISIADWGAKPLEPQHRPDRSWIDKFENAPTVIVEKYLDIEDAIDECNKIAKSDYCVVKVPPGVYERFSISRSKTKVVGSTGTRIIHTKGDIYYILLENFKSEHLQEIVIEGFSFVGRSFKKSPFLGILIEGVNIKKVLIKGNKFNDLHSDYDGHVIMVGGTGISESTSIQDVIIEHNIIKNTRTAGSENITISGNVKHWEINNNLIEDINNIAIDAIAGEGQSKNHELDAARYGFIENNTVKNFHYPFPHRAAAIYVDGGHHIHIEGNTTINTKMGFQIGAENCVEVSHIIMKHNSAYKSESEDFMVGGWNDIGFSYPDPKCDGKGRGSVKNITVTDNNFNQSKINFRITRAVINQRGVAESFSKGNGDVSSDKNTIRTY